MKKILFIDRSTGLETVDDILFRPRGGMVSSLIIITEYLSEKGMDVYVLSDIKHPCFTDCGVIWDNDITPYLDYEFDVLVCNRGIGDGYPQINAKHRILWTHDLPHAGFIPDSRTIKAFDLTIFMSKYAERIWRTFSPLIGRSVYIPNGVYRKHFFYPRDKDLNYLIYFSHPNRGLKRLPLIADAVKSRTGKDITFKAFSNVSMYPKDKDFKDHGTEYELDYEDSEVLEILDPLPTGKISEEVGKAGICILPSGYPEICSNSVLQSLSSGTPIITTGYLGATPEWVKHGVNGFLTEFSPNDYMVYSAEIIRYACDILNDEKLHRKLIKGARNTKIYSWDEIGRKWLKMLNRFF